MKQKLLHTFYPKEKVDLKEAFPDGEVNDFTPWLKNYGLEELNETLVMDIEIEGTEVPVGKKSADMVGFDRISGRKVVIENQLDKFDYGHGMKAQTYAAGLDASIIIWIFKEIDEELRATLEWLNDISTEDYSFFGVEFNVWKVGENSTTDFRIRVKPNNWKKSVKSKSKSWTQNPISDELRDKRLRATELLDGETFTWGRSGMSVTIKDDGYYCSENDTTYDSLHRAFTLPYKEALEQSGEELGTKLKVNVWKTLKNADGQTPDQVLDEVEENKS